MSVIFPGAGSFPARGGMWLQCHLAIQAGRMAVGFGSSPEVSQAQAANTLVRQSSGWFAHTTDGAGLIADLTGNHGMDLSGQRVLILGAGGAAAGILGSLLAAESSADRTG